MQRLHELDRLCHASFTPVSVDHPDIVKIEGVSALRDVSQHLRGSLMPMNGLFLLQQWCSLQALSATEVHTEKNVLSNRPLENEYTF